MIDEFQIERAAETADYASAEAYFGLLADANRRVTLQFLTAHDRTTVDELAAVLVGSSAAAEEVVGSTDAYEQATIQLHHAILPRLEDHDCLEYDRTTGEVTDITIPPALAAMVGGQHDG